MGYGSRAIQLLIDFFERKHTSLHENPPETIQTLTRVTDAELSNATIHSDDIRIRDINAMPPLFSRLSETSPAPLDYLGVSYGLTRPLLQFWKRLAFTPLYLRQTPNELTGEHSTVMLLPLSISAQDPAWLNAFARDFHGRFLSLLSYPSFSAFPAILALLILSAANQPQSNPPTASLLTANSLTSILHPFDLKRLDSYAHNMLDHHVILDLAPTLATFHFTSRLSPSSVSLTGVQSSILLAIGLQRKTLEELEAELGLPVSQLLAMFVKVVRKMASYFRRLLEDEEKAKGVEEPIATVAAASDDVVPMEVDTPKKRFAPLAQDLTAELREGADAVDLEMKEKQRALIDALPLDRYEIEVSGGWEEAEKMVERAQKRGVESVSVSVKTSGDKKRKGGSADEVWREEIGDREEKSLRKGMAKKKNR